LTNLIGGLPLTVSCTLVKNRIGIDLNVLVDTGVNGFAFIDSTLADQLCKGLGLQLTPLSRTIQAKGYDGQKGQAVSHYLTLNLILEGRRQYNIPFIVLTLSAYKVILGRKWFEYFYVNPDVAG
jgi:predicted aspartyl protease